MEFIAELLLQLLWWLLELLAELLLQLLGAGLGELLGRVLKRPTEDYQALHPWWAAAGYALFGAAMGAVSLHFVPTLFIASPMLRVLNVLATPLLAGACMAALGAWRRNKGQPLMRLDTFAYAVYFALAMSLVRYLWGR